MIAVTRDRIYDRTRTWCVNKEMDVYKTLHVVVVEFRLLCNAYENCFKIQLCSHYHMRR